MRGILLAAVCAISLNAQTLRIYAIDVEGGKSTLYVSPTGQSMLIDTGYAGNDNRDANRILAAMKAAGVSKIDYLAVTHYHGDHAGGVPQLAAKVSIGHFYDHGDTFEKSNEKTQAVFVPYSAVRAKFPHSELRPGDTIPIPGLEVRVVAAAGDAIEKALPGAGQPNPLCATYKALPQDPGENAHSLAFLITFGDLRIADFGDLFWNQEHELACPANKIGTVDLYMTTHHGTKTSSLPQLVQAMRPRVAIMNNGADKGGSVDALKTIRNSPGLLDLWQLHYSNEGGERYNTKDAFIANREGRPDGQWIEISARKDGTFTVRNAGGGFEKTYRK